MTSTRAALAPALPSVAEMRRAVLARDARYEGVFVFGVRTTGVFCRPGCPARTPRPENLSFHAGAVQARAAGLRPCRRCRPERAAGSPPAWMEGLEARLDAPGAARWSDADLVAHGLEPRTVRRAYLARYGLTFHAWQRARHLGRAHRRLRAGDDVLGVSLDSGYASESGFRAAFAGLFGTTPHRGRAAQACVGRLLASPLGPLLAVADERGVCLLEFADRASLAAQARSLVRWRGAVVLPGTNEHLEQLQAELEGYFAGRRSKFEVALDLAGPPFHLQVWSALRRIPPGRTLSYGRLAERLGRPGAQRAVASANRANRVAILVPCHRVVGADGRLTGYGGGLWRKRRLLEIEGLEATEDRLTAVNEPIFPNC